LKERLKFKPLGKGYNVDKAKDDFESAADEMEALLDRFEQAGYNSGAAMGGAMQVIIFRMANGAPNAATALGFMGSCMSTAAIMITEADDDETEH